MVTLIRFYSGLINLVYLFIFFILSKVVFGKSSAIWMSCVFFFLPHCFLRFQLLYVRKVSSHILLKIEACIEEDTRYKKHCTQDNDASFPFKVSTLGPHTVLPIAISCPVLNIIDGLKSLPFKR